MLNRYLKIEFSLFANYTIGCQFRGEYIHHNYLNETYCHMQTSNYYSHLLNNKLVWYYLNINTIGITKITFHKNNAKLYNKNRKVNTFNDLLTTIFFSLTLTKVVIILK